MGSDKNLSNKEEESSSIIPNLSLIIFIVLIILIYLVSLGKLNIFNESEEDRRLKWIKKRLGKLGREISNKKELRQLLNAKIKKWFLITRVVIVGIILLLNVIVFFSLNKPTFFDKLSILLTINQAILLIILGILFIRYEKPSDFKGFMKLIHLQIKRAVYKGHEELEKEIIKLTKEIKELQNEEKEIKRKKNGKNDDDLQNLLE